MRRNRMSVESKLGRRLMDLKDVTKSAVTNELIQVNIDKNLSLTENQIREISNILSSKIETTFDLSINNVMSVLKEKK